MKRRMGSLDHSYTINDTNNDPIVQLATASALCKWGLAATLFDVVVLMLA